MIAFKIIVAIILFLDGVIILYETHKKNRFSIRLISIAVALSFAGFVLFNFITGDVGDGTDAALTAYSMDVDVESTTSLVSTGESVKKSSSHNPKLKLGLRAEKEYKSNKLYKPYIIAAPGSEVKIVGLIENTKDEPIRDVRLKLITGGLKIKDDAVVFNSKSPQGMRVGKLSKGVDIGTIGTGGSCYVKTTAVVKGSSSLLFTVDLKAQQIERSYNTASYRIF